MKDAFAFSRYCYIPTERFCQPEFQKAFRRRRNILCPFKIAAGNDRDKTAPRDLDADAEKHTQTVLPAGRA